MSSPVILLSKPGCVQCNAVTRRLDELGIFYEKVDVSEDQDWQVQLKEHDIRSVPVTLPFAEAEPGRWVLGYDPDAIDALAG